MRVGKICLGLRAIGVAAGVLVVSVMAAVPAGGVDSTAVLRRIGSFGAEGTGSQQFFKPWGAAVDNSVDASSGDVYVVDLDNQRVEKLGAAGDFILMFGGAVNKNGSDVCYAGEECRAGASGAGQGAFAEPAGVAVDPVTGAVFVVDTLNHRVEKFSTEGKFELMFGGDVNKNGSDICKVEEECQAGSVASPSEEGEGRFHEWKLGSFIAVSSTGTVYVGDENRVQEFNGDGEYLTQIKLPGFGDVMALAVNESGDVFVNGLHKTGVREFDAAGVESPHEYAAGVSGIEAIGIEPGTGQMYIAEQAPDSGGQKRAQLVEYETSGAYGVVAKSEVGVSQTMEGLGIGRYGTVYATDAVDNAAGDDVVILGKPPRDVTGGPPATVGELHVTKDGPTWVELTASVNPHFAPGSYFVKCGTNTSYSLGDIPSPEGLSLPTTTETRASIRVEHLVPATEYHCKLVVITEGRPVESADEAFETYGLGRSGLPDGRVYEQVSPTQKNGNFFDPPEGLLMGVAEAEGNAVLYPMSGAVGSANAGLFGGTYISRRGATGGWTTTQTTPRPAGEVLERSAPSFVLPSAAFTSFLFAGEYPYTSEESGGFKGAPFFANIYLTELNASVPPQSSQWLTRPQISNPIPKPGGEGETQDGAEQNYAIAGASPNLERVYFGYAGTLLPEDSVRAPHIGEGLRGEGLSTGSESRTGPWGFYEWADGALHEAGTLPNNKLSAYGAIPASLGSGNFVRSRSERLQAGAVDNVVSDEGRRVLFVSPDPQASTVSDPSGCAKEPTNCTSEPPELYLREVDSGGGVSVRLVSGSQVPDSEGSPATGGVASIHNLTYSGKENVGSGIGNERSGTTYAWGSPDGSQAFFASVDRLTSAAPENGLLKEYDYDADSGVLTYLPGVEGSISAVSDSGETLMFVQTDEVPWAADGKPWELEVWHAGANGGTIIPVAALPEAELFTSSGALRGDATPAVRSAHVSADGNVFVFDSDAPIAGFNDHGLSTEEDGESRTALEVYRFEAAVGGSLDCLSCPPRGVVPAGDAYMSYNNFEEEELSHRNGEEGGEAPQTTLEARGMSVDGSRVFFDTPSPLVPAAVNGKRDVYEWENGKVYLLSSGTATANAYYLDNSESGEDVFFATASPLVPSDTDDAYDVYDARVPREAAAPPGAAPCKGSACQGAAGGSLLLEGLPSEGSFGFGNLSPATQPAAKDAVKAKAKKNTHGKSRRRKRGRAARSRGRTRSGDARRRG